MPRFRLIGAVSAIFVNRWGQNINHNYFDLQQGNYSELNGNETNYVDDQELIQVRKVGIGNE